ncbi:hypothetical protein [Legionella jordanis]|uniref:Secreted protein n=1 Tax=Legionella jordanis TaxID=456 RepID=A0A0W0V7Y7_9GAMM|nr:hypothetical protein [Legionella jordanis]KTD16245.1 hypothetical protein Ljor_0551 [Legionella jordanis]RMX04536.1 hypothetical protein EAW55_03635 [Legionella jordanis]RMX21084.1 hypothetical protein EAS68_05095 [Legionella jordanis]VEH12297.1 Uncharacterised protein [Legionella jordanis]HAT8713505.1 hypothetical protein [Legionella jordanis]
MRTFFFGIVSLLLAVFSVSSFADKVVITGEPVVLEQKGDVYYLPEKYTTTTSTSYHYVTVGGTNRVCYAEAQPSLASLNTQVISVNMGGQTVQWTCYPYDETYFSVSP